jgi:hypothetical protein
MPLPSGGPIPAWGTDYQAFGDTEIVVAEIG